ncbi:cytochrome P450 [Sorangium sp. So ce448]|uniref:cytochrome P450 n=1 Tax=Sorangium sp. So ce448 TaxID=3133314 RepID=UPI003F618783
MEQTMTTSQVIRSSEHPLQTVGTLKVGFKEFLSPGRFLKRLGEEFQSHDIVSLPLRIVRDKHVFFLRHPDHVEAIFNTEPAASTKIFPKPMDRIEFIMGQGGFIHRGGDGWRRSRRMVQPSVNRRCIAHCSEAVAGAVERLFARWSRIAGTGQPVDICREMRRLVVDVSMGGLFSHELGDREDVCEDTTLVMRAVSDNLPLLLPTPRNQRFRRSARRVQALMDQLIRARRRDTSPPEDVLTTLIRARDAEGQPFTDVEVRDEMVSIYLGAFVLGSALTWVWYALTTHPEYQRRVAEEAASILHGRPPTMDDLPSLKLSSMVFREATRLYPPGWVMARFSEAPFQLGEITFPARTMLVTPAWFTHRHPAFWTKPETFLPERFDDEAQKGIHKFAYYPFAGGPRKCLGFHLAPLLGQMITTSIAQRYALRLAPGAPRDVDFHFGFELEPKRPLLMTIEALRASA